VILVSGYRELTGVNRLTKGACLGQPISWSMGAMFCGIAIIIIVIVPRYPQAIPQAMMTMIKAFHRFF